MDAPNVDASPQAPTYPAANQWANRARAAAIDALGAGRQLAADPIGGLPASFDRLGKERGLAVGVVFGVTFDLCVILGLSLMTMRLGSWAAAAGDFADAEEMRSAARSSVGPLRLLILASLPIASIAVASFVTRKLLRGSGSFHSDVFVAGASLQPIGVFCLAAGILGPINFEVVAAMALLAGCCSLLMLYGGCTKLHRLSDRAAVVAVPTMLIVAVWVQKVVIGAMI